MSAWSWIFLAIVVVLLLAMLLARRASAGSVDPTQLLLDPDLVTQVRTLAQQNQKVAAITLLREGTPGLGLAGAKVMVERMAAPRTVAGAAVVGADVPSDVEAQARSLKVAGNVIGAITLVRNYEPDLQRAKEYVNSL